MMENVIAPNLEQFKMKLYRYLDQLERILVHENIRVTQDQTHNNMTI